LIDIDIAKYDLDYAAGWFSASVAYSRWGLQLAATKCSTTN